MSDPQWNVGDEVIVTGKYASRGRKKIVKVGRIYFYVEGNPDTAFKLSDGHQKHDGYGNYLAQCRTPEQYEADQVRSEVLAKLREHGVRWADTWSEGRTFREARFSTARLFELLHLLDQIAEENATTNLDRIAP